MPSSSDGPGVDAPGRRALYRRERATTIADRELNARAVRVIRDADVPWMVELARERYSNRFDLVAAEMWFSNVVLKQPVVFFPVRTDHAFCVALVSVIPWMPAEPEANLVMLCAEQGWMWDAIALLREAAAWAKQRRCTELRITSETAVDLGPIAKRLGAVELPPRFSLRFV